MGKRKAEFEPELEALYLLQEDPEREVEGAAIDSDDEDNEDRKQGASSEEAASLDPMGRR